MSAETTRDGLAVEVARLRELVLDQGEALAALTREHAQCAGRQDAIEQILKAMASAPGPQERARPRRHLSVVQP